MNKTTLHFDFCEPGTVKTAASLTGRGIRFCCTQLNGLNVYLVTEAAEKKLRAQYSADYVNDNEQLVA